MNLYKIEDRQLHTILAALRYYQRNEPNSFNDIATNNGEVVALNANEIDNLCESLNCNPPLVMFVATYSHKYGDDVQIFATEQGAYDWRDDITKNWWDNEYPGTPMPTDNVGEIYFERQSDFGEEHFNIEASEVKP